jgi:hypothetical protein
VPAHARREDARLDGGEDLRDQPVEADVGGRAWSATMHLQLSGLRQHVEAEAEIEKWARGRNVRLHFIAPGTSA